MTRDPGIQAPPRSELDVAYDNAGAVPDLPAILARWDADSERVRASLAARPDTRVELGVRYAPGERGVLDLFTRREGGESTLVFVHGGYWHLNAKERFSFLAEGLLAVGVDLVVLGYDLAPGARIGAMVEQVRAGVRWVLAHCGDWGGDRDRVAVAGWSAGGQLATMAMSALPQVRRGLAISGIFDLGPIRSTSMNELLQLNEAEVLHASPLHNLPTEAGELTLAVGGDELPELQRQTLDFRGAWRAAGLAGDLCVVPDRHHFAVLEELGRPGGALLSTVAEWRW